MFILVKRYDSLDCIMRLGSLEENNDNEDIAARRNEMENARNANGVSKMTRMKIMVTKNSMEMQSNKK